MSTEVGGKTRGNNTELRARNYGGEKKIESTSSHGEKRTLVIRVSMESGPTILTGTQRCFQ